MRQLILTCTTLFTLSLFAQTNLDSVTVSATRLAVKKYESGKNITVLSQQEIQQLPVTSVDELLQYVGGINVNSQWWFWSTGRYRYERKHLFSSTYSSR